MSSIPKIYINFVSKRPKLFWAIVLIPIIIGFTTHHIIGGQAEIIGGRIQAAGLIILLHYVISMYLYRDYRNEKIKNFMASWPVRLFRAIVFILFSVFSIYAIYFFITKSS